jgi:AraC-like DNA-binding protein
MLPPETFVNIERNRPPRLWSGDTRCALQGAVSEETLAFVQRCQVTTGALIDLDYVGALGIVWTCLRSRPHPFGRMDRVTIAQVVLRFAPRVLGDVGVHRNAVLTCYGTSRDLVNHLLALMKERRRDSSVTLADLAAALHISYYHLSRVITYETGHHFPIHLNGLRLLDGALLLRHTGLSIKEVAAGVGYDRTAELDRHWAEWFGMTPTEFRRCAADPRFP